MKVILMAFREHAYKENSSISASGVKQPCFVSAVGRERWWRRTRWESLPGEKLLCRISRSVCPSQPWWCAFRCNRCRHCWGVRPQCRWRCRQGLVFPWDLQLPVAIDRPGSCHSSWTFEVTGTVRICMPWRQRLDLAPCLHTLHRPLPSLKNS